ncbi:hypothetical protein K2173_003813 [Erythroxylum novogranatense]|uniref:DUF4283 domain-containing protein n=1 Tax=Erythroxylum novogranatense TaxID=1862640 RepID=A0AAV8SJX5_9ROSI|nr:hypothetical protein K2173_003813 [Erythroxylum novogranatense]
MASDDEVSKGMADSVVSHKGDVSTEEADNLLRSNKKLKRFAEYVPTSDRHDVEMEARDDSGRKCSYKDSLTGSVPGMSDTDEELPEVVSEDDSNPEDLDDPNCPTIQLTPMDKQRIRHVWANTLIIKCDVVLVDMGNNYYLSKFHCLEDYRSVLEGGPWMVADHILVVINWPTVWVHIPHLPVEYYDKFILTRIGNKLGKTMWVYESTEASSRAKYARVNVEIDLSKPLIVKFHMRHRIWKVEYEGLHLVCFGCGTYGHRRDHYPLASPVVVEPGNCEDQPIELVVVPPPPACPPTRPKIVENYGVWMLVQKATRGRPHTSAT